MFAFKGVNFKWKARGCREQKERGDSILIADKWNQHSNKLCAYEIEHAIGRLIYVMLVSCINHKPLLLLPDLVFGIFISLKIMPCAKYGKGHDKDQMGKIVAFGARKR